MEAQLTRQATKLLFQSVLLTSLPGVLAADGEYWSLDKSASSTGFVLSATRGEFIFGAGFTDYEDGLSTGVSFSRSLPLNFGVEGLAISAGLAASLTFDDNGEAEAPEFGVTVNIQRYVPTDFGNYFLQANYNTINQAYFLQAQIGFDEPGINLALSTGASTEYNETALTISKRLGDGPVSLRTGYRFDAEEIFVGFSVNTF